ncbi:MAG: hypothetical protein Q7R30_04845 [Acidobacteriota bacterium]|nr:hypothetical protein [Acidobacteriota bacterium]
MIRGAVVGVGLVAAVATALAQQPPPPQTTFRSGVDLVTIDVVATSANGAPVLNLTADDRPSRAESWTRAAWGGSGFSAVGAVGGFGSREPGRTRVGD